MADLEVHLRKLLLNTQQRLKSTARLAHPHPPPTIHPPTPQHPQALDALLGGPMRHAHPPNAAAVADMVAEFEQMARQQGQGQHLPFGPPPPPGMQLPGGAPPALAHNLKAFLSTAASRGAFMPQAAAPLPPGALSVADQCRVRDRSTILARQLYAEQGQGFADGQVAALLASLHIDPGQLPGAFRHVHDEGWHNIWQQQQQQQQQQGGAGPQVAAEMAAAAHAANMEAVWREQQQQRGRPWWV